MNKAGAMIARKGRFPLKKVINKITRAAGDAAAFIECRLCSSTAGHFKTIKVKKYYLCPVCGAVMLASDNFISAEDEKKRYMAHNNDVDDPGYRKFVGPVVASVKAKFGVEHKGLDFGAGPGPVIAKLLKDDGYDIRLYDPFFHNDPAALESAYDYIVCCEVMEHFARPAEEFGRLRRLLKKNGKLFCMTCIYHSGIDFDNWHYKNDTTHTFFYSLETLEWIWMKYGFISMRVEDRLIEFSA